MNDNVLDYVNRRIEEHTLFKSDTFIILKTGSKPNSGRGKGDFRDKNELLSCSRCTSRDGRTKESVKSLG